MSLPDWELQEAVYTALTGTAGLMAVISKVYDAVPANAVFPYVTIENVSGRDWSTQTFDGYELDLTIKAWSDQGKVGKGEVLSILSLIHGALHNAALAVTGFTLVLLQYDYSDVFEESDGVTLQGVIRFRALLHHA